jgi:phage N-6-adenine-methyltransferase
MTIIGRRAINHPAQVRRRGPVDEVDDRWTPPDLYADAARRWGPFDLDAAASHQNRLCPAYYTRADDGLAQPWFGRVWCNPPYSACGAWVGKAWAEWPIRAELVAMLLPADRTEQGWWQQHIEPHRDSRGPLHVEFLPGRVRFGRPSQPTPAKGDRPPFGVVLVVWGAE